MNEMPQFSQLTPEFLELVSATKPNWLDPASTIYTNRDLELEDILLVGFDMDYTLAKYHRKPMEQLQYDLTIEYLILNKQYPEAIRKLKYDPELIIRGLVVDKRNGNLLKIDAYNRVCRVMYGKKILSLKASNKIYANQKISLNYEHFSSLDTLFAMPEACLFCNLIDFFEDRHKKNKSVKPVKQNLKTKDLNPRIDTKKLFDDVRASIDGIHSNDSLKSVILQDVATYICDDPDIALTLHKLRSVGKKIFLLTNSFGEYADAVMSHILEGKLPEYKSWKTYFDIIIVGASKPTFFTHKKSFKVADKNNAFSNVKHHSFVKHKTYQGGNLVDFEKMAHCRGEQVLYVGDHIYGDIVLSKKESLWRTCLIVEELQSELDLSIKHAKELNHASKLGADRAELDIAIGHKRSLRTHFEAALSKANRNNLEKKQVERLTKFAKKLKKEVDISKKALKELDEKISKFFDQTEKLFHPIWGRLFREQNQLSRFGSQVNYYSCIYTSNLANLLQYSPKHIFRGPGDLMSHDKALLSSLKLSKKWLSKN